jgi:hypothetical protein
LIRVKVLASIRLIEIADHKEPGNGQTRQEGAMPRYMVRFVKDVLGENGRQAEICQRSMEVDANNKLDAAELAKKNFCGTEGLSDWSLHADRIQIADADFSS